MTQDLFQEPKIQQRKKNSLPTTTSCSEQLQLWTVPDESTDADVQDLRLSLLGDMRQQSGETAGGPQGLRQRPSVRPWSLLEQIAAPQLVEISGNSWDSFHR